MNNNTYILDLFYKYRFSKELKPIILMLGVPNPDTNEDTILKKVYLDNLNEANPKLYNSEEWCDYKTSLLFNSILNLCLIFSKFVLKGRVS